MNLSNHQEIASSLSMLSTNRKRKAEENDLNKISSKRLHFEGLYRRQNWLFPDSIIYYMAKNPSSSKLYQKMVKTCKYFFNKNPIIICSKFTFDSHEFYGTDSDDIDDKPEFAKNVSKIEIEQNGFQCIMVLNNISYKFWITDAAYIKVDDISDNVVSSVITCINQCNAKEVTLCDLTISMDVFTFFATNIEDVHLFDVTVKDKDDAIVPLEILVEVMVNVKSIDMYVFCFYDFM